MFWGCVLKEGEPYKVQHALEDGDYPVLHLSNAVLSRSAKKDNGKSYVTVTMGKELKNLSVAVLSPERNEMQSLDLYLNISQNITISVSGKNEVHLSGYFEPNNSLEDQLYGAGGMDGMEDEEGESDLSDDEDIVKAKSLATFDKKNAKKADAQVEGFKKGGDLEKSLKAANKNTIKNTMHVEEDSEDSEMGDMGMDDEESGEDLMFDLEAEDGEDEDLDSDELVGDSDEDEVLAKLTALKKKAPASKKAADISDEDDSSDEEPTPKKAAPIVSDSDDESENDLQALLKNKQKSNKSQKTAAPQAAHKPAEKAPEQKHDSDKKKRKRSKKHKK